MQHVIVVALSHAAQQLAVVTDVPRLEAEILLAHVLQVSRSYLHTWPEKIITLEQHDAFSHLLARRLQGEPIAYLIGHREFWSIDLTLTPDVLIPRPETELLVELVLQSIHADNAVIADLGTGSGAIALALAQERPSWQVYATDASHAALAVAKYNAKRLNLERVTFLAGSWCQALPDLKFDAIVSNPPYIAEEDAHLNQGDLRFEPRCALASAERGLQDLKQIIWQAKDYLKPGGFLFLEHGFDQAKDVATFFVKADYTLITHHADLSGLDRVTIACR